MPACLYLPLISIYLSVRPAPGKKKKPQIGGDWPLFPNQVLKMQQSFAERLSGHCCGHVPCSSLAHLPPHRVQLRQGAIVLHDVRRCMEGAKTNPIFVTSFFMAKKLFFSIFNNIWWGKSTSPDFVSTDAGQSFSFARETVFIIPGITLIKEK